MIRCLNCMKEYNTTTGTHGKNICPYCGFVEKTRPKVINHLYPGTILHNRYVVGTVIGAGGFGVVYKAWDPNLETVVAIKEYFPQQLVQRSPGDVLMELAVSEKRMDFINGRKRFLEEARTIEGFKEQPNIVDVKNYFEENNTAYYVMEYLDGMDLKHLLEKKKIQPDEVAKYFRPVMEALRVMHEKGVIHRDINPKNIFVLNDGTIKIIDFGAARLSFNEQGYSQQLTIKYAPIEQYSSKSEQGPFTDIYALGATIYHAITGAPPDAAPDRSESDNTRSPMDIDPKIPKYLSNAVMKAIAVKSELRFQQIDDDFIKAFMGDIVVSSPEDETGTKKLMRNVLIAAIVLFLIVASAFIAKWIRNKKELTDLKKANVVVWVPYDTDEDNGDEKIKEEIELMSSGFIESYKKNGVEITVETIPSNEYIGRLESVKGTKNMPDLFLYPEGIAGADELLEYCVEPENVFSYIEEESVYFLFEHEKEIIKAKKFPIGFETAVAYVRRMNVNDEIENIVISNIDSISHDGDTLFYVDSDYYELTLKSLQTDSDFLKTQVTNDDEGFSAFEKGELMYYLASTDEFRFVSSEMPGLFEMRPYDSDKTYGFFTDYWCVSSSASRAERIAAEALLSFYVSQAAQDEFHITEKNSIPLNKESFKEFVSLNGKYSIIPDFYMDNIELEIR